MKTYRYIIALIAGAAVLSCTKEMKELPAPQDSAELVTIRATLPENAPLMKAGPHSGFSWRWSAGDKLTVMGEGGAQEVFTIKSGFSSNFAEFEGKAVPGEKFTILFPDEKALTTDWSKQTQAGNGSIDHLKYEACLTDVDDYMSFTFSPEWAAEHGGSLKHTGVLKFTVTLPADVKKVTKVTLSAPTALFYGGNGDTMTDKLALDLSDCNIGDDHLLTAWMTTSWNEAVVPVDGTLSLSVGTSDSPIAKTVTFTKEGKVLGGKINTFVTDAAGWTYSSRYASGSGTEADPWIITSPRHMSFMAEDMADGETRYFKLGADIDMAEITDWVPLNAAGSFEKRIDFNGDGHTISNFSCSASKYSSFFGVLYGKCYDVKFVNATINATTAGSGILGGYCGTTGKPGEATRVSVQGTINCEANNHGGLFGNVNEATITACSADVVITAKGQCIGGLFGVDPGLVTVRDCWSAGSISTTASIAGGICGDLKTANSSIYNCYSTASVTTQFIFGGIVGRAVAGQKSNKNNCTNQDPKNHIEKCIAWNDFLKSDYVPDTSEHYGSGAVVGQTAFKNYLTGCIRRSDLSYTLCAANIAAGGYDLFDQEDADPDHPMVIGTGNYAFGYNGKAAAAGKTISQVAQDLGWSSDVWDFSGNAPKLK